MRSGLAIAAVTVAVTSARVDADTPAPARAVEPDLRLRWTEGEMSRDMSLTTVEITVTGTKLHYHRQYSGRNGGMPGTEPKDFDTSVKDPRKLADALIALDKVAIKKVPPSKDRSPYSGPYLEACVTRAKVSRCGVRRQGEQDTDELKAITTIRAVLVDGMPLDVVL